jgi:hypothetical protein
MKNLLSKITLFIFLTPCLAQAQTFYEDLAIPVTIDGEIKVNGFAGGHNTPQFSEVDFNNDGVQDLYVFDREGGVSRAYLQVMENGIPHYEYAPEYHRSFPELSNWVLMRDYNADGAADIFASAASDGVPGVKVFRGYFENDILKFEPVNFFNGFLFNVITFPLSNGFHTNAEVTSIDYPALDDVDNDSDLDLLSFDGGGSYVVWYRNMSVENGFGVDSLIFKLEDDCWGGFKESGLSPVITLSDIPGECVPASPLNPVVDERHAGSTILTFDEDNDIDREMLIGDLISPNLVRLHNEGVLDEAWMDEQDITYPTYDVPVEINYPAAFYLDVDFDGANDLIAAPNETNNSPNYEVAWFYKNTNTTESPVFDFQQRDFLTETMIDIGENAYPAIADVTGDGLLDIVVGNVGFFLPDGTLDVRMFLFENTGTETTPAFTLVDDDWLNFNQYSSATNAFQPTFGDMDSDGDLDLLVGENGGWIFYAENTAGAGNPMDFPTVIPHWQEINVGQRSSPTIGDLNQDGLPDLVIGERNPFLNFYPNQGTATNPVFQPLPSDPANNSFFGEIFAHPNAIDTIDNNNPVTNFSTPLLIPFGNKFSLFVGNEVGTIWRYDNIGGDLTGAFLNTTTKAGMIDEGRESSIAAADLDNDGFLDFVVGNRRGGLRVVATDILVNPLSTATQATSFAFDLFPNPASDKVVLNLKNVDNHKITCTLYNALGVRVETQRITQMTTEMNIETLPSGVYFCEIMVGKERSVERFVKQ